MECTERALQTIEYGPQPEVQRCMLVLSANLTGASVDHGRRPILVSLSTFSAADTKKLGNGMCNDQEPSREESQAIDLRLDSKIAESCSLEMQSEGSQNAAANQASSAVVQVVSRSVHFKMRKKRIFLRHQENTSTNARRNF